MRKNYLLPLLVVLVLTRMVAQPSLVNYTPVRSTGITYASINLTGSSFASWRNSANFTQDDNRSDYTDIGFDFWYNGIRYTQFCVSTNGFIDFATSTADGTGGNAFGFTNSAFSQATAVNATRPAIAPFYDDLTAQGGTAALGNSIKYLLSGTAPSRTLTIEWINMAVYQNTTPSLNFQVKLVESTGKIFVNYGTMNAGTNTFSYSMGLNSATVSAAPTAAQLKMLQTPNSNTFSQTAQNNQSTMPAASSQYQFTPPVPTPTAGSLTFSGVAQTSMTLNWTNWASNEVGYVIYNSTDGLNYDFVTQSAINATTANVTGLLPSTTYFWKLFAVTEGCLSAAINGTQATTAAGNKISRVTGLWNTATTWTPTGVPTAADNVTIADGHTVSIDITGNCNNLVVGQTAAATLQYTLNTARLLTVNNNVTVNPSASFIVNTNSNATHSLDVGGNFVNNGTINFATDANSLANVTFSANGNQTISGTGATTNFNRITVDLGGSIDNILAISSSTFSAASDFLTLTSGTVKLSTSNAVNITAFNAATTMPANAGLWLNSPNLTVTTNAGITLYGDLTVSNGTLNLGNAADEDLVSSGGSISLSGGAFNIAGKLDGSGINNICEFTISGGTLTVPTFGSTNTTIAPFHIANAGSQCNMTGGVIVIQREGGGGTQNLGFINTGTSGATVTGGTLQIGNASTPAAQIMLINTDQTLPNLLVKSANATAQLSTNTLSVRSDITISTGTLIANNLAMSLGGNWSDAGTFTPGTGTVTFNGTSAQSVFKSGGETFNGIEFTGAGVKTFSSPVTANSTFSIASGASVDVSASNQSLTLKGSFMNSGTFNAQSGLVTLSGTSSQTIGGASTTSFYNLTLNNSAGALLSNAENLKNALTLTTGTFNTNSKVFTMLSDASNTARIAQITGGNFSGNATIQRFVPGGSTGWSLLGSPLSSTPTISDWDADTYISCSTCPDGSAAGFISVYTYSEAVSGAYDGVPSYIPFSGVSDPITPGKGYWVYLGDGQVTTNNITLDLTGTPNKFAFAMPLKYTNHSTPTDDGWNLITNPYPSPISWALLKGATANVDNAVYVYNTDLNSGFGTFASYVNGVSSPAVGSGGQGDVIAMGQGFYVHATAAATLTAQETNKVATNTTFLKTESTLSQPLMRLTLTGANAAQDETVLYFDANAGTGFDIAYDAYKLRSQDPGAALIALQNAGNDFQINGIAPVNGNYTTAVKALSGNSGTYTITANNISSFPSGACITLYDNYTSITTNLQSSDYVCTLSDTTTVARFRLNISLNALNATANVSQPTCTFPNQGAVIASGNSGGPWNYYWSSNGSPVKTSLNKAGADTLSGLANGNFDLAMNTVGACDHYESSYAINGLIVPVAAFNSIDTVFLNQSAAVQFHNISVNDSLSYWDFGTSQDFSATRSPAFSYSSPGIYPVSLVVTSSTGCTDTISKLLHVMADELGITTLNTLPGSLLVKTLDDNVFLIQGNFEKELTLKAQLSDASGRLLMDYGSSSGSHFNLQVDLTNTAHGIYFLSIVSDAGVKAIKLPVK